MWLDDLLTSIEDWPIGRAVAESEWLFPFLESIHVVSLAFVVGSIFFVDLRLLGIGGRSITVRAVSKILPYTWGAFVIAAITGVLMFAPAASRYASNWSFLTKFVFMFAAGVNMLIFHFGIWRSVGKWNEDASPPTAARVSGLLSAALWVCVVFFGRLVPFLNG